MTANFLKEWDDVRVHPAKRKQWLRRMDLLGEKPPTEEDLVLFVVYVEAAQRHPGTTQDELLRAAHEEFPDILRTLVRRGTLVHGKVVSGRRRKKMGRRGPA